MTDDPAIHRFRPADTPALVALFRDTVRRVNGRDYTPEQVRAWAHDGPPDPARWATLADRFTVVAEIGGEIAGFADLEADGHVDRFFVHADHQRRGVGRAMIRAVIDEAVRAGMGRLSADVSVTARPFFERYGFVVLVEQRVLIRCVELTN